MMLLYAVIPAHVMPPEIVGVAGRPLECIRGDAATVIVEDAFPAADALGREEALQFARILGHLVETASLLPVRFPTVLPSRKAVHDELSLRGATWRRRLMELDGRYEMMLRIETEIADVPGPIDAGPGATYLTQRAEVHRSLESSVAELEELAGAWTREIRRLPTQRGARLACLVEEADIAPFRAAIQRWSQRSLGCRVETGGPWPAFSFANEESERA